MQIKPEEKGKAAVLVLFTVLALAFAAKTVLGAKRPAPASPPASSTAARPAAGSPGAAAAPVPASAQQTQAVAELYMAGTAPAPATRDPFKPPISVVAPPTKKAGPVMVAKLPPAIVKPPSLPAVALKGVIDGDPPIAVFEGAGGTQYVKKGEPLAPGTQVAHISEAGVVLKYRGKDIALMVGHSIAPVDPVPDGLHVRPVLPAPTPGRTMERATITSAPPVQQPSGTGITEISPAEVQLPGRVPFQIASVNIPAAPTIDIQAPVTPQPEKRTTTVRQTATTVSRHRVRRHKHRRHRKHGRHHRHRHRHAAHQQAHTSPAPQAPAAQQ